MKKKALSLLLVGVVLLSAFALSKGKANANQSVLIMAYMEDCPLIYENDGQYYGYAVDYFNSISEYTHWDYRYIRCSFGDALKGLRNGSIDFVIAAQKSSQTSNEFFFSDNVFYNVQTYVYVDSRNDEINYNELDKLKGNKIGYVNSDILLESLIANSPLEQGSAIYIHYNSASELHKALFSKEIDAFVCGSTNPYADCKLVACFGNTPYYTMTSSKHRNLLATLNEAEEILLANEPSLFVDLNNKYFNTTPISCAPLYTSEDLKYISQHTEINIGLVPLPYPLSGVSSSDSALQNYIDKLSAVSGLHIETEIIRSNIAATEQLRDDMPIICGIGLTPKISRNNSYTYTTHFIIDTLVPITKKLVSDHNTLTCALTKVDEYAFRTEVSRHPDTNFVFFNSFNECLDAVNRGEADFTLADELVAEYYTKLDTYKKLYIDARYAINEPLTFIAKASTPKQLISIMNKTIDFLTRENYPMDIIYTFRTKSQQEINTKYISRPVLFSVCVVLMVITVILIIINLGYNKKVKTLSHECDYYKNRSEYDRLTGLYTYNSFLENCSGMIHLSPPNAFAMVTIKLEHFKVISDIYGFEEADNLTRYVANVLKELLVAPYGIACSIRNNCFVALCSVRQNPETLFGETFIEKMSEYPLDNLIESYIGIYYINDIDLPIYAICEHSEIACSSIHGKYTKHLAVFNEDLRLRLKQNHDITQAVGDSLIARDFFMQIQPKHDIKTNEIIGGEALVRWNHPEKGLISPGLFIPILEENGYITKLDLYMIETASKVIRDWLDLGYEVVPISVNLSRKDFFVPSLVSDIRGICAKYNIPHKYLQFEITENAYFDEFRIISDQLSELHRDGFEVILDNFGCEYTSLNVLKNLPIDMLKLDIRFLSKSDIYNRSNKIIYAIADLMKDFGIKLIAESVETEAQVKLLESMGCSFAQGFFFSHPEDVVEFANHLRKTETINLLDDVRTQ